MIEAALAKSRGKVAGPRGAAATLGIPASTLESKIKQLGIQKRRFTSARGFFAARKLWAGPPTIVDRIVDLSDAEIASFGQAAEREDPATGGHRGEPISWRCQVGSSTPFPRNDVKLLHDSEGDA